MVTYHRIGSPAEDRFYDPVYSATSDGLRAQLQYLRSRFRLLNVQDVIALAENSFLLQEPTALVTFDDGYRDNATLAVPILAELRVPAVFFLPTSFLEQPRLTWWDRVAYVLKQTAQKTLVLERPEPMAVDLEQLPRSEAVWKVIEAYIRSPDPAELEVMRHLEERAEVSVASDELARDLFMTWDDVRSAAMAGVDIGSHSHGHPFLARLDESAQRFELTESKRILEEQTGREVVALAYPYGDPGMFTEQTEQLALEAGYRVAFAANRGINRPGRTDRFAIRRIGIGSADSLDIVRSRAVWLSAFGTSPF